MEELLLLGLGAVAVALSPFVPAVRPVAKAGVKGGLVLRDAAVAAAGLAAAQVGRVRAPWSSDGETASQAEATVVTVDVVPAPPQAAPKATRKPAAGKSAAKRPARKRAAETGESSAALASETPAEATNEATTGATTEALPATAPATPPAEAPKPTLVDINGIGPKAAEVLAAAGIASLEELAEADPERLRTILTDAGSRYRIINPDTWPEQARALLGQEARHDHDGDGSE